MLFIYEVYQTFIHYTSPKYFSLFNLCLRFDLLLSHSNFKSGDAQSNNFSFTVSSSVFLLRNAFPTANLSNGIITYILA